MHFVRRINNANKWRTFPSFFNLPLMHTVEVWRWFGEWLAIALRNNCDIEFYVMLDGVSNDTEHEEEQEDSNNNMPPLEDGPALYY